MPKVESEQEAGQTVMPWDGQEVSIVKPSDGTGFGMNIDANCVVLSFLGENSAAEAAGVSFCGSLLFFCFLC